MKNVLTIVTEWYLRFHIFIGIRLCVGGFVTATVLALAATVIDQKECRDGNEQNTGTNGYGSDESGLVLG